MAAKTKIQRHMQKRMIYPGVVVVCVLWSEAGYDFGDD
jgi:hypothetical protein